MRSFVAGQSVSVSDVAGTEGFGEKNLKLNTNPIDVQLCVNHDVINRHTLFMVFGIKYILKLLSVYIFLSPNPNNNTIVYNVLTHNPNFYPLPYTYHYTNNINII